jgi:type II secretory pathway component PulK
MSQPGRHTTRRSERGFALLIVLGMLPLLSMMIDTVLLDGRTEVRIAGNLRRQMAERSAVEGAVYETVLDIADGQRSADGSTQLVSIEQQMVRVTVSNDDGRINPNLAPLPLLRGLFLALGYDAARADTLAACIVDFRGAGDEPSPHGAKLAQYRSAGKRYGPSGLPFARLDELRLVLGIDQDVYDRMRPYVSVYSGSGIDLGHADPVVRGAYRLAGPNAGYPQYRDPKADPLVVGIVASLAPVKGDREPRAFMRAATVQFPNDDPHFAPPFRILDWADP